jgi:hypothetical protein
MNAKKTKAMVMSGGKTIVDVSKEAFSRRMRDGGMSHKERQREKVVCERCDKSSSFQNLCEHQKKRCQKIHRDRGAAAVVPAPETEMQEPEAKEYRMSFPVEGEATCCPVDGCPAKLTRRGSMRMHFRSRYHCY